MAAQNNGRAVRAGPTDNPSSSIGVVRWLATGAVDSEFGMDGIATLAVIPVEKVRLALAPDG